MDKRYYVVSIKFSGWSSGSHKLWTHTQTVWSASSNIAIAEVAQSVGNVGDIEDVTAVTEGE